MHIQGSEINRSFGQNGEKINNSKKGDLQIQEMRQYIFPYFSFNVYNRILSSEYQYNSMCVDLFSPMNKNLILDDWLRILFQEM